jgi:CRP-like cAMP-binding protein
MQIPEEAQRRLQERLTQWHLPTELVTELAQHSTVVWYPKGGCIFLRGSTADVAFWIIAGLVKVYYPNSDASRMVTRLAGPGDFVGMADVIESKGRRVQAFEAEAATKATLALFTREHVVRTLQGMDPVRLVSVIESLNTIWSSVAASFVRFVGLGFRQRLETVLADLAVRFGVKDSRGVLLTVELSHDDLAELIASSRAMVSRLIAELIEERVVARQGKRYILLRRSKDLDTLASFPGLESRPGKRATADRMRLTIPAAPGGRHSR